MISFTYLSELVEAAKSSLRDEVTLEDVVLADPNITLHFLLRSQSGETKVVTFIITEKTDDRPN